VGAGAGATVGKLFGASRAMKGGIGRPRFACRGRGGGRPRGGERQRRRPGPGDGSRARGRAHARRQGVARCDGRPPRGGDARPTARGQNTSIGVVATNVALTKAEATKVAQMAHDGLARSIRPVHTPWDGDTLFALSTAAMTIDQAALVVGRSPRRRWRGPSFGP